MIYTAIYYLNKVMPRLAERLADYFFPVNYWELPHNLNESRWMDRCIMCEVEFHS